MSAIGHAGATRTRRFCDAVRSFGALCYRPVFQVGRWIWRNRRHEVSLLRVVVEEVVRGLNGIDNAKLRKSDKSINHTIQEVICGSTAMKLLEFFCRSYDAGAADHGLR